MGYQHSEEDEVDFRPKHISLEISKKRFHLNRPTSFSDQAATMLEEVMPNRELEKEYIRSESHSRGVQAASQKNLSEVNTTRIEVVSQGMNHTEGG